MAGQGGDTLSVLSGGREVTLRSLDSAERHRQAELVHTASRAARIDRGGDTVTGEQ